MPSTLADGYASPVMPTPPTPASMEFSLWWTPVRKRRYHVCQYRSVYRNGNTIHGLGTGQTWQQIEAAGGGPSQSNLTYGKPSTTVNLTDVCLYYQDDWKVCQNFTFSYGVRWESQRDIADRNDWAPRLSFAYALGKPKKPAKTVIRGGYGFFYDRFRIAEVLQATRQSGVQIHLSGRSSFRPAPATCRMASLLPIWFDALRPEAPAAKRPSTRLRRICTLPPPSRQQSEWDVRSPGHPLFRSPISIRWAGINSSCVCECALFANR